MPAAQQHVGVAADDDVGAGLLQRHGQLLLLGVGALAPLGAPVQEHDDGVAVGPGACGPRRRAGRRSWPRPGPPWVSVAVHAVMRFESSTWVAPITAIRWPLTSVRHGAKASSAVVAHAHDGEVGGLGRGQRVGQADRAVVEPVVVGHGGHVDAGAGQRGERRRGSPEREVLGHRRAPGGDGRLEVDHGQVGGRQHGALGRQGRRPGRRSSSARSSRSKWTSPPKAKVTGVAAAHERPGPAPVAPWCRRRRCPAVAVGRGRIGRRRSGPGGARPVGPRRAAAGRHGHGQAPPGPRAHQPSATRRRRPIGGPTWIGRPSWRSRSVSVPLSVRPTGVGDCVRSPPQRRANVVPAARVIRLLSRWGKANRFTGRRMHRDPSRPPGPVALPMPSGPPAAQGLYDPAFEHDACGVSFVVHMKGLRSHEIVDHGIGALVQPRAPRRLGQRGQHRRRRRHPDPDPRPLPARGRRLPPAAGGRLRHRHRLPARRGRAGRRGGRRRSRRSPSARACGCSAGATSRSTTR